MRLSCWIFGVLILGAALGGVPASASVSLVRTDVTVPGAPDSVALGDLDGRNGPDIAIALPALGSVGVMLNNGDGTLAAIEQYTGGPNCAGTAVDITLGDVTRPTGNRLLPDGNLDAYVACTPYVVRLTGDGTGALGAPEPFNLGVQQYLGADTLDMLELIRRPDDNPAPLLLFQHAVGSFGRQLCVSYELDPSLLSCSATPVQGPLATGDLNGTQAEVPPDEIVTSEGGEKLGVFGFAKVPQLVWADSFRTVPGGTESATLGDLDNDGDLDVLAGTFVNSLNDRVASMHSFDWGATGLDQVAEPLQSIAGLDAVAIADVDGDRRNDVIGAGDYGRGVIHLGTGDGNFDGGQDLPQLGYQSPSTATRVTQAVGDLTGDGRPEIVIADALSHAVMVFRNDSVCSGAGCPGEPATTPVPTDPGTPPSSPGSPGCANPGTTPFTVGTPGEDVLVGSPGRDVLSGAGGDDCLFGLGGKDRLSGGTGDDILKGSSGDDRLNGDAGEDRVDGGRGNDAIAAGGGKDRVTAGGGQDAISARDSTRDQIDCGTGRDKVTADRADSVKSNCESVRRPT